MAPETSDTDLVNSYEAKRNIGVLGLTSHMIYILRRDFQKTPDVLPHWVLCGRPVEDTQPSAHAQASKSARHMQGRVDRLHGEHLGQLIPCARGVRPLAAAEHA